MLSLRLRVLVPAIILFSFGWTSLAGAALAPWQFRTVVTKSGALLQNEKMAVYFPKTKEGHCRYEVWLAAKPERLMGLVMPFSRLLYLSNDGEERRIDVFPDVCAESSAADGQKGLKFTRTFKDVDGVAWHFSATFSLAAGSTRCNVRYTLSADQPRKLIQFRGPTLFAGESSFGTAKDEALFPGLEYLLGDERSSSRLDVTSKERKRFAPHPYKVTVPLMAVQHDGAVVGLLWNANQKWDGKWECPQPLFSSPNWLEGKKNHLMMLSVPSFPWHEEYAAKAATPYPLESDKTLSVECKLLARPVRHVVEAIGDWLNAFGYPEVPRKPRSWEEEVDFSVEPYIGSLWKETEKGFGWIPWTGAEPAVNGDTLAILSLASSAAQDKQLASDVSAKIEYARKKAGLDKTWGSMAFGYRFGPADKAVAAAKAHVYGLIDAQKADGSWVFGPPAGKTLLGVPVESLGEKGESAVGLCAAPAARVLEYALVADDRRAAWAGLRALGYMERFVRPQAAQVWECPVHTPDILAAGQAVDAYLKGYLLAGNREYLERAKYWAWTGLPFVYLWNAGDRSSMRYSTIAIFGASMFTWPWFGRPVQWNGLAYADGLRRLAPHDRSFDWRTVAKGITIATMQQQAAEGENAGLYPDSWYLIDDTPGPPWMQPAQFLLSNVCGLLGHEVEPQTMILRGQAGRVHMTAVGRIEANLNAKARAVWARVTDGNTAGTAVVSVAGLGKPEAVTCGNAKLAAADSLHPGSWVYRDGVAFAAAPKEGTASFRLTYSKMAFALPVAEEGPALGIEFAPVTVTAGQQAQFRARLRNRSDRAITQVDASLELPIGWFLNGPTGARLKRLGPGESSGVSFGLTPPSSEAGRRQWIGVKARYSVGTAVESARGGLAVKAAMPVAVRAYMEDTRGLKVTHVAELANPGGSVVSGTVELAAPPSWTTDPPIASFRVEPGKKQATKFTATAPEGTQPARYPASLHIGVGKEHLPEIKTELEIAVACPKAKSQIRVDGSLGDWSQFESFPITQPAEGLGKISGPGDLSARARIAWSDKCLYLALEVTDDKFAQTRSGPDILQQDSLQVAFDTLRDANTGGYENDDYEYGFALTPTNVLAWRWHSPLDKPVGRVPMVEVAIVRDSDKTVYEIGIPWAELAPFQPAAGRSLAMSILVNDDDGAGRKGLEWGGGIVKQKQPVRFIGVRLRG